MRKLKHLGYFNNVEYLKHYANKSADEIVSDMFNNFGEFHKVDDFGYIDEDDLLIGTMKITTNGKYAVVDDLPINMNLLGQPCVCEFFIDIYEIL